MTRSTHSVALLVAAAIIAGCSKGDSKPAGGAAAIGGGARRAASLTLSQTDVARAVRMTIEEAVAVTGDLRPIETLEVKARLEGDLESVLVREGERVSRGQLLANFEASEQTSARRSAEADRVAARGALSTAQWDYEQSQELFKAGAVPEHDMRVAEQTVATAKASLAAADARVRATGSNEGDTRVLAPTSGIVEKRLVESGERVARGASMFTIVRTDVLELAAAVPARQSNDIRTGQTVHFSAGGQELDGRVARVSPTIDPSTRSVTVYVQVPNANGAIRGGTAATGRIVLRTVPDALVVPSAAIRQDASGASLAYRIRNQLLEPVKIATGVVDAGRALTQIASGLRQDDMVVVGNVGTLGRGMKVTIIGADNPAPGPAPTSGR